MLSSIAACTVNYKGLSGCISKENPRFKENLRGLNTKNASSKDLGHPMVFIDYNTSNNLTPLPILSPASVTLHTINIYTLKEVFHLPSPGIIQSHPPKLTCKPSVNQSLPPNHLWPFSLSSVPKAASFLAYFWGLPSTALKQVPSVAKDCWWTFASEVLLKRRLGI